MSPVCVRVLEGDLHMRVLVTMGAVSSSASCRRAESVTGKLTAVVGDVTTVGRKGRNGCCWIVVTVQVSVCRHPGSPEARHPLFLLLSLFPIGLLSAAAAPRVLDCPRRSTQAVSDSAVSVTHVAAVSTHLPSAPCPGAHRVQSCCAQHPPASHSVTSPCGGGCELPFLPRGARCMSLALLNTHRFSILGFFYLLMTGSI